MKKLLYEASGDNYLIKDPFKLWALAGARKTRKNLKRFSQYGVQITEIEQSRGESAYRIEIVCKKSFQLVHVEEGVGTKNVIADELAPVYGPRVYQSVAVDNVASILNDLATTGAAPLSFMLHIAAYPTEWFSDEKRARALIEGTVIACNDAGCVWGGGESATMRDIIIPDSALLSGSATGLIIPSDTALSEDKLVDGDRIILIKSSGVHTNGITLLRKELVKRLPHGYKTKLSDGETYGEALLTPSFIYARLMEKLVRNTEVHYAVNITGHGWRKLMRANKPFVYIIEILPMSQPIFHLIQKYSHASDADMYDSYNMGAGFAIFVPEESVGNVLKLSKQQGFEAINAGYIQKGNREVQIVPLNIHFTGDTLKIR